MARPKLVSADQPLPVQVLLRIYELAASLQLAVLLLFGMAFTLALATAVEATFSTAVVQFYVYQSWWFNLMYGLLALNIFCAAVIRYPWKRYQTGFVITHIGLLVLMFSGVISRQHGIDSQVHVWENSSSNIAFDDSYYFRIVTTPKATDPHNGSPEKRLEKITSVDFYPGVFSWADYSEWFSNLEVARPKVAQAFSPFFYISGRHSSGDELHHEDGVKLEVLDYYGDSDWQQNTPSVELRISMPAMKEQDSQGRMVEGKRRWIPLGLSVRKLTKANNYRYGFGDSQRMGGGSFTFSMLGTLSATNAFLESAPEGKIGPKGQAVLHVQGQKIVIDVAKAEGQEPVAIEGTKLKYQVVEFLNAAQPSLSPEEDLIWKDNPEITEPKNPAVKINILSGDQQISSLVLFGDTPEVNLQDYEHEIFGDFWFDHGEKSSSELIRGEGGSRIDIVQGIAQGTPPEGEKLIGNKRLYYRYWNRKEVVISDQLPLEGLPSNAVDAFSMPIGTLQMYVKNFVPSDKPKGQPIRIPFTPEKSFLQPAAKVRLTIDGLKEPEEFWLWAHVNEPTIGYVEGMTQRTFELPDRTIAISMPIRSTDIGFRIFLEQFERKLDPGTTQAAHYSSDVRYIDRNRDRMLISFNSKDRIQQISTQNMVDPRSPIVAGSKLYWIDEGRSNGRSIYAIEFPAKEENPLAKEIVGFAAFDPQALAVDLANEKIYWTDRQFGRSNDLGLIREANLDGSSVRTVTTFAGSPDKLAIDSKNDWIFFTDSSRGTIGKVKLDGTKLETRWIDKDNIKATGIAVDPGKQILYWSDQNLNAIRATDYAGKSLNAIYLGPKDKGMPNSLAFDLKNQLLYWTDIAPNAIDPNAAKNRNDTSLDRTKPREILTRVRSLKLGEKNPTDLPTGIIKQPGEIFCDQTSGELFWSQSDVLKTDVWITMNAPDDYSDPIHGRNLRIFQESFDGPYKPGTREYAQNVPVDSNAPEVYRSVFSVNYDPGTPLRYWGCFLVCIGIACMFYMRAYFFPAKTKKASNPEIAT